jgi:protein-S-isoprenylcysteine O-methyltransferase Ste14
VLGRFLFRWRGVIGLAAFGVLFWLARPTFGSCFAGVPFLLAGLAVRFWASGYIGIEGRAREIGASRKIVNGPYRLLRHPLYIGNFLLVAGMLVALRPSTVVIVAVLVLFVVEYSLIVIAEERDLAAKWKGESGNYKGATEEKALAGRRGQKLEARSQKLEVLAREEPMANGEGRGADGESFSLSRAMCEWRTWVATGVAFGLALLKASVAAR